MPTRPADVEHVRPLLLQGWTIPWLANCLRLMTTDAGPPPANPLAPGREAG